MARTLTKYTPAIPPDLPESFRQYVLEEFEKIQASIETIADAVDSVDGTQDGVFDPSSSEDSSSSSSG